MFHLNLSLEMCHCKMCNAPVKGLALAGLVECTSKYLDLAPVHHLELVLVSSDTLLSSVIFVV